MLLSGLRDHLPSRAERLRTLDSTLLDFFGSKNYRYVITPLFERMETFERALGGTEQLKSQRQFFRALDPHRGELVAFRPDILPQVARLIATRFQDETPPFRLCYSGRVVRADDEPGALTREIFQVGCELMGEAGLQADVEMVVMAATALRRVGLKDFKIDLGQIEFARGLLDGVRDRFDAPAYENLLHALRRRDLSEIEHDLKQAKVGARRMKAFLELPGLFGGGEVLERAKRIADNSASKKALQRLASVYAALKKKGLGDILVLDLGEIRGFNYYTGLMIQAFARECGHPLLSGGRYDQLLEKFGRKLPALGVAADLEMMLETLERQEKA